MGIRMEYNVEVLPQQYTTERTTYAYVPDPEAPQEVGKPIKKIRVETKEVEKGGWLFTFMRGHQIRCTSEAQIKLLGLSTTPRLIDDSTGLEVNAQGIPIDIADHIQGATPMMDGGAPDTGATLMARRAGKRDNPIDDIIKATE